MKDLHEQQDAAKFETALRRLPAVLRDEPDDIDFVETAQALARQLLMMQNRFALACFVDQRFESLTELCVLEPVAVARTLISLFYSESLDVQQRVLVLEVLSHSAQKLAGLLPPESETSVESIGTQSKRPLIEEIGDNVSASQLESEQRIEKQTRRWGSAVQRSGQAKKQQSKPRASPFREAAPVFFFDLMRRVDEEHEQLHLINREDDGLLIGRLIHCGAGIFFFFLSFTHSIYW